MTPRQTEVLDLMCQGYSNHEMAEELGITVSTVKTHIWEAMRKLHAGNRVQAAVEWTRNRGTYEAVKSE